MGKLAAFSQEIGGGGVAHTAKVMALGTARGNILAGVHRSVFELDVL